MDGMKFFDEMACESLLYAFWISGNVREVRTVMLSHLGGPAPPDDASRIFAMFRPVGTKRDPKTNARNARAVRAHAG